MAMPGVPFPNVLHLANDDVSLAPNFDNLAPVFLGLQIAGGQVCLPIIIATFLLSKTVYRHPTLINFCLTWVLYSISYSILLYSGKMHDPPGSVCFAQSAMVHGAPTMCAVSTLVVVVHIWWTFRDPCSTFGTRKWPRSTRTAIEIALPYVTYVLFTMVSAVLQYKNPGYLAANGLYCSFILDPFRRWGVPSFCTATVVLIIGFEIAIGVRFYRMRRQIHAVFPLADRKTSPTLVFRVLIFNVYSIITLSAGVSFLSDNLHAWPFFVQAALPLTAAVVFGTQKDLFRVWFFCIPRRKPDTHSTGHESLPTFRHPESSIHTDTSSHTPSNDIPLKPRILV